MANDQRDFLVDDSGRLIIRNGALAVGPSLTQEVALLLLTNKGELRHDPLAGCDLPRRSKSVLDRVDLERTIRIQLERDGKRWSDVKDGINLSTNG